MHASISTMLSAPPRPARICSALLLICCSPWWGGITASGVGGGDLGQAARVVGVEPERAGQAFDDELGRDDRAHRGQRLGQVGAGDVHGAGRGEARVPADADHGRAAGGQVGGQLGHRLDHRAVRGRDEHGGHPRGHDRDRAVPQVGVRVAAHRPQAGLLQLERGLQRGAQHQPAARDDGVRRVPQRGDRRLDAGGSGASARPRRGPGPARRRGRRGSGASAVPSVAIATSWVR